MLNKCFQLLVLALALLLLVLALPPEPAGSDGKQVAVVAHFSPGGDIEKALVEAIGTAEKEILVAMYTFTSRDLADALVRAKQRGLAVYVILDRSQANIRYGKRRQLEQAGIELKVYQPPGEGEGNFKPKYHHKYMVVDRSYVATGSFNWTSLADSANHENLVLIRSEELAMQYGRQFQAVWNEAK